MEKAKVYFDDFRVPVGVSLLSKLAKLIRKAGMGEINFDKKLVAIKMHFGEPGNLAFLRPNYAKVVADVVKELGGTPFLTDCNTLYAGRRKNALEHLDSANENGFFPMSTGCQILIGDGLRGFDEVAVPVEGGKHVKHAKIGQAILDADIVISLNHFKGHELTGFGGAIKNIGMGSGSRAGKMEMHGAGKPSVAASACVGCGVCSRHCGQDAITYGADRKAILNHDKCVGCGRCIGVCSFDAIYGPMDLANSILNEKMAEYALAVLKGRPHFHISLVQDISPNCDCHGENDAPILPDIGMFASFDPVALDQACADACLAQQPMPNSQLSDRMKEAGFEDHHDHFVNTTPDTEWESCLAWAEEIGVGTRSYEMVKA